MHCKSEFCFKAGWKKAEWSVSEDELFICLNRPHDLYGFSEIEGLGKGLALRPLVFQSLSLFKVQPHLITEAPHYGGFRYKSGYRLSKATYRLYDI